LNGDTTKARKAYQDFFALWKDADSDIPVLQEAQTEYEKLKMRDWRFQLDKDPALQEGSEIIWAEAYPPTTEELIPEDRPEAVLDAAAVVVV
jgi:hypothetical protein